MSSACIYVEGKQKKAIMNIFMTWLSLVGLFVITCTGTEKREIKIATGERKGIYYKVGRVLEKDNSSIDPCITDGSVQNIEDIEDYYFGIVQSDVLYHYGEKCKYEKFKVIGTIYREPVYILIRSGLILERIADLRGKKVAIGLERSGTRHTSETILGIFGISKDELKEAKELKLEKIANEFENGELDAAILVILDPKMTEPLANLINNGSVKYLKIDRRDLTKIASTYPNLYSLISIPDPRDVNKQFPTISVTAVMIANPDRTDKETVCTLVKQLLNESFRKAEFIKGYESHLEPYPFLLYRKIGKPDKFHEDALDCYKSEMKNLIIKYRFRSVKRFWLSFSLCFFIAFLFMLRRTRLFIMKKKWRWIYYGLIASISAGYFLLYLFESNVENPDITGGFADLYKMFALIFKTGDVFCLTDVGNGVKIAMLLVSGFFATAIIANIGDYIVGEKIREVFKMIPKANRLKGHVVICNWTARIEGVIKELRHEIVEKRKIIILTQPTPQTSDKLPESSIYDDVYVIIGDPKKDKYLERANISSAYKILILADEVHSDNPDAASLMTLLSVKGILDKKKEKQDTKEKSQNTNEKEKKIIVEVLDPEYEELMRNQGADEIVSYPDIRDKLLAQAVITPGIVEFIREILTIDPESNEIYILEIPQKYNRSKFRDFACKIDKHYASFSNPLTVVGIRRDGKLYVNPKKAKKEESFKIKDGDEAVVLAWEKPGKLPEKL